MKKTALLLITAAILMAALLTGCLGHQSADILGEVSVYSESLIGSGTALYSVEDLKTNPETKDLFFSDFGPHTKPTGLLVIVFNYNNSYYDAPDEEVEREWADYLFGADDGAPSANGYFREVSQGQFWFEPIRVGDNTSGVHVVHLDKDYSFEQFCHEDYAFFDFSYDAALVMDELINGGLDISRFRADGIDAGNYVEQMMQYYESSQDMRPSQWFDTDKLMFVFPPINSAKVDITPLSTDFADYGLYCHLCQDSNLGTIVHELMHTLGAVDVYNYCYTKNDLMSNGYDAYVTDGTAHIDPYYKLVWGWCRTQLATDSGTVKLYPATSDLYSPVLIPTDDPNQYFLIENRRADGCDSYIAPEEGEPGGEGLSVWRVDRLALEKIYTEGRRGISMEGVLCKPGEGCELMYYASRDDVENDALVSSGIVIEFTNEAPDYIEMRVEYRK